MFCNFLSKSFKIVFFSCVKFITFFLTQFIEHSPILSLKCMRQITHILHTINHNLTPPEIPPLSPSNQGITPPYAQIQPRDKNTFHKKVWYNKPAKHHIPNPTILYQGHLPVMKKIHTPPKTIHQ